MDAFTTTLICVAVMLAYAVPGFILVKVKMVKPAAIPAFATVLMYVCQPGLTLYSFDKADYTPRLLANMGIFFAIITAFQIAFILFFYLIWRKKFGDVKYRIGSIATVLTNCSFFGVPILEALFPTNANVAVYSMMYFLSMSLIGWTLVSYIITGDKKYISIKKILLNPATLSIAVALPLFITKTKLVPEIADMATILGKMTTPMCMFVLGMRLATMRIKPIFTDGMQYLTVFINQILFPVLVFAVIWFTPLDLELKQCMFVMCSCPIASVVLNYAEILGQGQERAANTLLLGTILSIATVPILMLLMQIRA